MMTLRRNWPALIWLFLYFALHLAVGLSSNFYASLNDFWHLLGMSKKFSVVGMSGLQDGFFGYLYPLLLTVMPEGEELMLASLLSLATSTLTLFLVYWMASSFTNRYWGFLSLVVLSVNPVFFSYASLAGADMLALTFLIAATALASRIYLLSMKGSLSASKMSWGMLAAASLAGFAATTRFHLATFVLIPIFLAFALKKFSIWPLLASLIGVMTALVPQVVINMSAGVAPLHTMQWFNVFRHVIGVDWNTTHLLEVREYSSASLYLLQYPYETLTAFVSAFAQFGPWLAILVVASWVAFNASFGRVLATFAVVTLLYASVASFALSERALLPVISLAVISLSSGLAQLVTWLSDVQHPVRSSVKLLLDGYAPVAVATTAFILLSVSSVQTIAQSSWDRMQAERERNRIDYEVFSRYDLKSMQSVFTNDFDFYSTRIKGNYPLHNGGIQGLQANSNRAFTLDTSSRAAFLCEAEAEGVSVTIFRIGNDSGFDPSLVNFLTDRSANGSHQLLPDLVVRRLPSDVQSCPRDS